MPVMFYILCKGRQDWHVLNNPLGEENKDGTTNP